MKMKRPGTTVCVGLCVIAFCVFGGRSFSADTVVSVLSVPGGPLADDNAVASNRANPFIKGLSDPADLSETTTNRTLHPSSLPPIYRHFKINGEPALSGDVIEVTDQVKVEISYAFGDPTAGYTTQGDRFVVIYTPWGEWYSFEKGDWIYVEGVEGVGGDPFTVTDQRIEEVVLDVSFLGSPFGAYRFFLAFDENRNGEVDSGSLKLTSAVAQLRNPIKVSLTAGPMSGSSPLNVTYQVTVQDPHNVKDTCMLLLDSGAYPCASSGNTHTYTQEGSHAARAEVKDKFGRTTLSEFVYITVDPPHIPERIEVSLSAYPTLGNVPLDVNLQLGGADPAHIMDTCTLFLGSAQFPCGTTGHTFTEAGVYPAKVTVTDIHGRTVHSNTVNITVEPKPPVVVISAFPTSGRAPLNVNVGVSISDPNSTVSFCRLVIGGTVLDCLDTRQFYQQLSSDGQYAVYAFVGYGEASSADSNIIYIDVKPEQSANRPPTVSNLSVTPPAVYSYDESFNIYYEYNDPDGLTDVKEHRIGIGVSSLSYPAGGSGLFQESYHFVEPSTPGTHYIEAYVVDSAGNYSNRLNGSVYFGGGTQECGTFTEAGSDLAETHYVELGQTSAYSVSHTKRLPRRTALPYGTRG